MRILLSTLVICFVTQIGIAQYTDSAFLNENTIEAVKKHIQNFESNLAIVTKAMEEGDAEIMRNRKSKVLSSLATFQSFFAQNIKDIKRTKKQINEKPANVEGDTGKYYFDRNSKNRNLQLYTINSADESKLNEISRSIVELKRKIGDNNKNHFFPGEENTKDNLELSQQILNLANNYMSLLDKCIVLQ